MGAWGHGTFDNDTACDWGYGLEEQRDLSLVRETLERVLEHKEEYLDSDPGCEALAACEIIARLKGNWGERDPYTEPVDEWVESHAITPPPGLVEAAVSAIDRILTPPSELLELWGESSEGAEWRKSVEDLRARVRG
jgi:hypothetical protein